MSERRIGALLLAGAILAALGAVRVIAWHHAASPAVPRQAAQAGERVPVLVELFTSEGCSSCPRADAMLARFVEEQPIDGAEVIALEEHVDYWNHQGWWDPYSAASFTQRQTEYSDAMGLNGPYTPQMVVDGSTEFVGSDEYRARQAIAQAALTQKAAVSLSRDDNTSRPENIAVDLRIEKLAATEPARVWLAVTEDKLSTAVDAGENAGHRVAHSSVVRRELPLGEVKPGTTEFRSTASLAIPAKWRRENLRVVVFAQERKSRRIRAVGAMRVEPGLAAGN